MIRRPLLLASVAVLLVACKSPGVCETPAAGQLDGGCKFVYDEESCTNVHHGTFHPLDPDDTDKVWNGQRTCAKLGYTAVVNMGEYAKHR